MARAAFRDGPSDGSAGLCWEILCAADRRAGCNVPSVIGARTLDAPRERLMTIMMAPFMSCGARLAMPVRSIAASFGRNGALAVFSLYMLGIG